MTTLRFSSFTLHSISRLLAIVAAFTASTAFAASFSFSYIFGSTDLRVTGTFKGVERGLFVEEITDLKLSLNDTTIGAEFFSAQADGSAGAIVSFEASNNNFAFADTDLAGGDWGYSHLFYMAYGTMALGTYLESPGPVVFEGPADGGVWTLERAIDPSPVPDHGVSVGVLAMLLAGLATLRRRFAV